MENNKEYWSIEKLREWEKNPRSITKKDFERLKKQIQKLGQYKPLIITADGMVIGGNMRLKAYKELGITNIWVSIVQPKDENQMLEYALSDNDRAGFYDSDLLANLLPNYNIEWSDFSVDLREPLNLGDLLDKLKPLEDEEEVPEVAEGEAISKQGELYQLGRHFLLCGDATKIEDYEKLLQGKKVDLVHTDPPYNVNYDYTSKFDHIHNTKADTTKMKFKPIFSDKLSADEYAQFILMFLENVYLFSKDEAPFYIWFSDKWMPLLRNLLIQAGWYFSQNIIWVKENFVIAQSQDFHRMFEPCVHGWKKDKNHYFFSGMSEVADVWQVRRDKVSERGHPTQKPIELIKNAILKSSKKGDIILDPFAGSGSTLMTCEQLDRICYTIELDPRFCDVIRKRYAKSIGKENEWETATAKI